MATSEKRKDKDGVLQEKTLWARVTLWGRQAETASQYLTKGRQVYIEGRPDLSTWTDRDGKERTTLEVNATDMQFIGDGGGGGERQGGGNYQNTRGPSRPSQGAGGGGGRPPGPKEQLHQARQNQQQPEQSSEATQAGLSLNDDDPPF